MIVIEKYIIKININLIIKIHYKNTLENLSFENEMSTFLTVKTPTFCLFSVVLGVANFVVEFLKITIKYKKMGESYIF